MYVQFKVFLENRIEGAFFDVRLLFGAVREYATRQKFDYDERVAETIWIEGYNIPRAYHLDAERIVIQICPDR